MLVKVIDLTVTIPVFIFVVSRQSAALMIDSVRPDIFPTCEPAVTRVSELYALIAVVHIVMTPLVVRVSITAVLHICKILLSGDSGDSSNAISEFADTVLMCELKLETHVAVTVHILLRWRCSHDCRHVRTSLTEETCPFTMEVVE